MYRHIVYGSSALSEEVLESISRLSHMLIWVLTVNGIWGGVPPPLLQDFFVKNIGILYAYDFLTLLLKFY